MGNRHSKHHGKGSAVYLILLFPILIIGIAGSSLLDWFNKTFGVTFEEMIYTIKSPLKGADTHFLRNALIYCLPAAAAALFIFAAACAVVTVKKKLSVILAIGSRKKLKLELLSILMVLMIVVPCVLCVTTFHNVNKTLRISEYLYSRTHETDIYDRYYVFPDAGNIRSSQKRNLLLIYLESMETTYASVEDGGRQPDVNYIPGLTALAKNNISFSNTDKLGGFHCGTGATWTIAAFFACQSGIPFSFPVAGNDDFSGRESFAGGTVMLGDILKEKGYYQEFLCGSDATFGGRKAMFEQHGEFDIYDLNSAIRDGYLTEDETVWWGVEDRLLYEIAKDELTRISAGDEPFNLTMLTVDTHHVDGWVCPLCKNEYPDRLANVVACADAQITGFIDWCREQPWYDSTVIVIQGDHPRMDKSLVKGVKKYDRTVYNCFINAAVCPSAPGTANREFNSCDMFPTILGAMGFEIDGDRLGLGTDLFSDRETLSEELGYKYLNSELKNYSSFYVNNFY
ncbi:MAG: LTA synthase family protein [Lachnospiraceae bacterium]|nr:LTA synthase family protein [Lachnospiraceae bacterium]